MFVYSAKKKKNYKHIFGFTVGNFLGSCYYCWVVRKTSSRLKKLLHLAKLAMLAVPRSF